MSARSEPYIQMQRKIEAQAAEIAALREREREYQKALAHVMVCDFPEEVDFRCDGCNAARAVLDAAPKVNR